MELPENSPLCYKKSRLHFDNIPLDDIVDKVSTPFYLYSQSTLIKNYSTFINAAKVAGIENPLVCFALKANPNLELLKVLAAQGSGADIVSGGELNRALDAGISPQKIVFSGVGKTREEIERALDIHAEGIYSFNVESLEELELINIIAKEKKKNARIAFRLNPHVKAKTHKNISTGLKTHKFGLLSEDILASLNNDKYFSHSTLKGLSIHIGSQLLNLDATKAAVAQLCECVNATNIELEFLDIGGGLGIDYSPEDRKSLPSADDYMGLVVSELKKGLKTKLPRLIFEPGRFIAARAGIFLTQVIRTKSSGGINFAIVDGGMNDFARTSLYEAYHEIYPILEAANDTKVTVVGPICETTDCFATNRPLPKLKSKDFLCVADTGAYGFSMASTYNLRSLPKEVIVENSGELKIIEY